jgi:hypothetical protein
MIKDNLNTDDLLELDEISEKILPDQICESLERMAKRELELLEDPRFNTNQELKSITLWNVATLCAAIKILSESK